MSEKKEMTMEREATILVDAIAKLGHAPQIIVAIEEMAELQKALTKHLRNPDGFICEETRAAHVAPILKEMADVYIMLNQLCLIFGDPTEQEIAKLERLEAILAGIPDNAKGREDDG